MVNYKLSIPQDPNGQPIRLFRANQENNTAKAIDKLAGICAGILADGEVNDAEARFFADHVRTLTAFEPVWPLTDIIARLDRIFADGRCDDDEREELKAVMSALCGHTNQVNLNETCSTELPFDTVTSDPIIFFRRNFVITGKFAYGTRAKVQEAISKLGGSSSSSMPTSKSHYLVIGIFASRDWITTHYGRKIERAVELRESGSGISIISEEHWLQFIE
jgi:NAD-dependent DNA ligase